MKKAILILSILFALFAGCTKYPDGPSFTLRTAKSRMVGTWKIEKLLIDNADSTDEYVSKVGCEVEFLKDIYNPDGADFKLKLINCNNGKTCEGFWELNSKNKYIDWIFFKDTTFLTVIGPIGANRDGEWTILKLTNKELKLFTYSPWSNTWGNSRRFDLEMKKQ